MGGGHPADALMGCEMTPNAAVEAAGTHVYVVEGGDSWQPKADGLAPWLWYGLHAGLGPLNLLRSGPGSRTLSHRSLRGSGILEAPIGGRRQTAVEGLPGGHGTAFSCSLLLLLAMFQAVHLSANLSTPCIHLLARHRPARLLHIHRATR